MRTSRVVITCLAMTFVFASTLGADDRGTTRAPKPYWIWGNAAPGASDRFHFRSTFVIDGESDRFPLKSAVLIITCDNTMTVHLNGTEVAKSKTWNQPVSLDVRKYLRPGKNVLAVVGTNEGGPAGLIGSLQVICADDSRTWVVTEPSWKVSVDGAPGWSSTDFEDGAWKSAVSRGGLGQPPWGDVFQTAKIPKGRSTPAESLNTLDGFSVELLYSVPNSEQGSWVSMAVDPKGRLIVSAQYGDLYRITPPPTGGVVADVERLEVGLGHAQGLLYAFDSLYVVVALGKGKGLYRLQDLDGDDHFETRTLLKELAGGGEHGAHAIVLGPRGRELYIIAGNHTALPEGVDASRVPRVWGEDQLLPVAPAPGNHASHCRAPAGWVCKLRPDGSRWELVASGMRNAYDIAFNREGDLFTYDSDMEWDVGTPWYRPTRVLHLVSGSDFGWRYGSGKWPEHYPDSWPAVVDIGRGSPTGVVFGYGARFPARYQEALFILDWTYGRLLAVHLEANGSSYVADFEPFVWGKPLPLTDAVVHPDGALYFTTGGRRVQSGLYRVTYRGAEDASPVPEKILSDEPSVLRRFRRDVLERLHGRSSLRGVGNAWPHLGNPDRHIRAAARVVLESTEPKLWAERVFDLPGIPEKLTALLALARAGEAEHGARVVAALDALDFAKLSNDQRLEVLRVYSLCFVRRGAPSGETKQQLIASIDAVLPSGSDDLDQEALRMLVYLDAPSAVTRGLELFARAESQTEAMFPVFLLRNTRNGWTTEQRRTYFEWLNRAERGAAAGDFSGGGYFLDYVKRTRAKAVESLDPETKEALAEVLAGNVREVAEEPIPERDFVADWTAAEIEQFIDGVDRGRSFQRGRRLFREGQCLECHTIRNRGGAVGQDLTTVGNKMSPRDIVRKLIDPSASISSQYQNMVFTLDDDDIVVGRIIERGSERVRVSTDPLDSAKIVEISTKRIVSEEPSPISIMPASLLNTMTREEILDLLAFLISGADANDPAFDR